MSGVAYTRLDVRDACGVVDRTPFKASLWWTQTRNRRVATVTLDELILTLCAITKERETQVRYRIQDWRRDGLLPAPRIVSANRNGKGGTRGDWGNEHVIGYRAIEALRPNNKPLTIVSLGLGYAHSRAYMRWWATLVREWSAEQAGAPMGTGDAMQWLIAHPIPEERLRQGPPPPTPVRVRLNTQRLQQLIPMARGATWTVEQLDRFLTSPCDGHESEEREALATMAGLFAVWAAVAQVETGQSVTWEDIDWQDCDARTKDGRWHLRTSPWFSTS